MLKVSEELNRTLTAPEIRSCYLYDLEYEEGGVLRWVGGKNPVLHNGFTYEPSSIKHSDISQDTDGKINDVSVTVGNLDRIIQHYINQYDLIGKPVKVTQVFWGRSNTETIVDAQDEEHVFTTGDWVTSNLPGAYGSSARVSDGTGSFEWRRTVNGPQEVYAWYPEDASHTDQAVFDIYTNDVLLDTIELSQKTGGGQWIRLGEYEFDNDARTRLEIKAGATGNLCADAIKFFGANGPETIIGDLVYNLTIKAVTAKKDVATFTLGIGLDVLKLEVPGRKIFSKSCSWRFKDNICQYKGPDRYCSKTFEDCHRKKNIANFGGFPGVINERLYF